MRSYVFAVVLVEDAGRWHAAVPVLEAQGAATWGTTEEEALRNIAEVAQLVVETLLDDGEPIPPGLMGAEEALVTVNVI
jgi:predicted RNase H-like HicB family nuclease